MHTFKILSIIFSLLLIVSTSEAAYVEKIKGKKTLIYLDGLRVSKGSTVYTVDSNGKRTSIMRITTVSDGKAIGEVVRGRARINQQVTSGQSRSSSRSEISGARRGAKKSPFSIGGMLGFAFDNMEIQLNGETIDQTGTGFTLSGVLDYKVFQWFTIRGMLNYDKLGVSSDSKLTANCCSTDITYMGAMLWAKVQPTKMPINPWVGGGFGIYVPMSKESNALDKNSIATTGVYAIGAGADININAQLYLPVQVEYMFLPSSGDVKTNIYGLRAGLMYRF